MALTADTWAVVAATGLGPVLAVALTLGFTYWRETEAKKERAREVIYNRRLHVFRVLMSTRRVGISLDHVNAINLIEVDFYGCAAVEAEWKTYKNHLNDNSKPEDEAWRRTKEKLLSKILFEIAKVLKFDIPAIEIFEGGYAPGGWAHRDMRYIGALEYLHELREGSNHLPLWTRGVTPPAAPATEPSISPELLKAND
jgi:hypothetical protein